MFMKFLVIAVCLMSLGITRNVSTEEKIFPDVGGILDFSKPKEISDRVFILTNPKSGSHVLLYSIMKVTQRPMRGRLFLEHFLYDPLCYEPENIMEYPLDFTKPTTYWGHEYKILRTLNHSRNKLIFISRDYKENLVSQLLLDRNFFPPEEYQQEIEQAILEEVYGGGSVFADILGRWITYDHWDPNLRYLVRFKDLVQNPNNFLPQVLSFIGDDSPSQEFIQNFGDFKKELMDRYRMKQNATGSGEKLRFFRQFISSKVLRAVDQYMQQTYPILWDKYLKEYQEI
jgi:hypothetical protein